MSHESGGATMLSALEQAVAKSWRSVLRAQDIGPDDNFFDLGGDSLQLLAVHSNLQKTLDVEVAVVDLFEFTTVRRLAVHLANITNIEPLVSESRKQGERQRAAFARLRQHRTGNSYER